MKFLVDECLGARLADRLTNAGHDAIHAVAIGLAGRPDPEVMSAARAQQRVLLRRTDRTAGAVAKGRFGALQIS